jgi:hypothetical protein
MGTFKDLLGKNLIEPRQVLDLVCYKNKTNILKLRERLGDETFKWFLDTFAGAYIRFPKHEKLSEIWEDAVLAQLYNALQAAKRAVPRGEKVEPKDRLPFLKDVTYAETKFIKQCEKMKIDPRKGVWRAKSINADLKKAAKWKAELAAFDTKEQEEIV